MTLDELISTLQKLREDHGGKIRIFIQGEWQGEAGNVIYERPTDNTAPITYEQNLPERLVIG